MTKYGKRMLRRWICHPLQNIPELDDRLDAVEELSKREDMALSIREDLRVLPDLERLVARVRGLAGSPNLGVIPMAAKKVHQRRVRIFTLSIRNIFVVIRVPKVQQNVIAWLLGYAFYLLYYP